MRHLIEREGVHFFVVCFHEAVRPFFWRLWRPAMLAHQAIAHPSGFAPSGTVVVSHEVKKWIRVV